MQPKRGFRLPRLLEFLRSGEPLTVEADGLREIVWWVLGYGDQAEVLDPPELRGMVLRRARGTCAVHCGKE